MKTNMFDVTNKVVLVTGSTRGIGYHIAEGFLKEDAHVFINGRTQKSVSKVAEMFKAQGYKSYECCFDITDENSVDRGISLINEQFGRIDVLINNAGIQRRQPFLEFKKETWDEVIQTNLSAVFTVSQKAALLMKSTGGGRIINISSLNSIGARPTISAYCAAKAGLNMLTKSMATELGQYEINVNAIAPGYFITELTKSLAENKEFDQWVKSEVALKRWGDPSELIGTAIYLASDASSYTSGQIIVVDGGWLASL